MLLKLTEINFDYDYSTKVATTRENPVWVVPNRVVFMRTTKMFDHQVTNICLGAPHWAYVKETPEEIGRLLVSYGVEKV
jgi:hypothetical protein